MRLLWAYSRWAKFSIDVALWSFAIPLAFVLRLDTAAFSYGESIVAFAVLALPIQALVVLRGGFHRQSWGIVSGADIKHLLAGVMIGSAVLALEAWFLQRYLPVPRSVPILAGASAFLMLAGVRLGVRWWAEGRRRARSEGGRRVLILGAGEPGSALARDLLSRPETGLVPVGFLDQDPAIQGLLRQGIPVLGTFADLPGAAKAQRADEALLALPGLPMGERRRLLELAERAGVTLRSAPSVHDLTPERRHVLVIGGAGYIGSALVPLLLQRGYRVRVLDLLLYGEDPIREFADHPRFSLIQGDFRQVDKVVESLQGVDTVIHLGGLVGDPACALDADLTIEVNLMATKVIAEVAKGYGVSRFIFASTCSVYGEMDGILDESSPVNPISLYARTKVASERVLLRLSDEAFAPTILRFGTVYGFSGRTRFDLVVNLFAAKAVKEGTITLFGGDQWRPFVHVEDVARGVLAAVDAPYAKAAGRIFNVGSDEQNHTLAQVAERVREIVPSATIVEKGANADKRNYRVSFRRIRTELGFEPQWTLAAGITQVTRALLDGKVKDYRMPVYSNVQYLTDQGLTKLVRRELLSPLDALEESLGVQTASASPPDAAARRVPVTTERPSTPP